MQPSEAMRKNAAPSGGATRAIPWKALRPLAGFLGRFLLCYGLLIAPWPRLETAYRAFFRAAGAALFGEFGLAGTVYFDPKPAAGERGNTLLVLQNRNRTVGKLRFYYQARHPYLAAALTAALILATPVPWSRRWKSLVLGLVLVHAFAAWRLWLGLLYGFGDPRLGVYQWSPFVREAIRIASVTFFYSSEFTFVAPVFIWVLVSFRREDWERLRRLAEKGPQPRNDRR